MPVVVTIERHIMNTQSLFPKATGELSRLLNDISLAAKLVHREVSRAGLIDILGPTGEENPHGEKVQKLDRFANEIFIRYLSHGGHLCVLASEECEDVVAVPQGKVGKYILLIDPLDGSSNIDVNISIGSVFSIYRRKSSQGPGTLEDCLQPGVEQVAAGYIIYGSGTMFLYTTGDGVHGFTLDPGIGEFLLSNEHIQIPFKGRIYSVNEGNSLYFSNPIKRYLNYLKDYAPETNRPYTSRYVGSMVADIHRTLFFGGIFMYPSTTKSPNGKLRLLYEVNPMAFIVEQAGGKASDGCQRILEIKPERLHQRTPLFIGSKRDVEEAEAFLRGEK